MRSVGLCVGQNQMCHLCGWLKLFLKKCGGEKNKKHWVGFQAVQLEYCLYVFGSLSKWFVFVLMFKFWSVSRLWNGRPTIGYNGFQLGFSAGFWPQHFLRSWCFKHKNKIDYEAIPPHWAKVMLVLGAWWTDTGLPLNKDCINTFDHDKKKFVDPKSMSKQYTLTLNHLCCRSWTAAFFIKRLHTCHVEAQANANLNHQHTHNTDVARVNPKVRQPDCAFAKFSFAHTLLFEALHLKRFIQMRHEFL